MGCGREGQYICRECQRKLVTPEQICPMCGKPSLDGWLHARCKGGAVIQRLVVGLPYRGMVQQCLKKVKYKSSWEVIDFLFGLSARALSPEIIGLHQGFIVVPVPMYTPKERERGFNQADRIAELMAKNYKVHNFAILERVRATKPMFGLKKKERRENVEGAFKIMHECTNAQIRGMRIILVDDVWTTGATMRECAKVLKYAGAGEVWGVSLAR